MKNHVFIVVCQRQLWPYSCTAALCHLSAEEFSEVLRKVLQVEGWYFCTAFIAHYRSAGGSRIGIAAQPRKAHVSQVLREKFFGSLHSWFNIFSAKLHFLGIFGSSLTRTVVARCGPQRNSHCLTELLSESPNCMILGHT